MDSNPYTRDCPKRVMIQHVHRQVILPDGEVKTDAGLWVNPLDFRGLEPLRPFLAETQWRDAQLSLSPAALREEFRIYGDLPWSLPVRHMLPAEKSWYLPAAVPELASEQPEAKCVGSFRLRCLGGRTKLTAGWCLRRLEVLSSTYSRETDRRTIHLRFSGPSHMNLFIDAKATRLTSWCVPLTAPFVSTGRSTGRPTH